MEILTEFDELQEAMKKINLDESVMPYMNGRIVSDDVSYNKVQKILDCPEMISAHKYLYNLDLDQLSEEEAEKVDKLYKLGCDRGFIQDDLTDWDKELAPADDAAKAIVDEPKAEEKPVAGTLFKAKVPCWTVIYSAASKDGQIKTGEAYSNAISASAAKADVKAKLSTIGYSNITILAIESCEADVEVDNFKTNDEVKENDILKNKPHNGHVDASISEADDEEKKEEEKEDEEPEEEEEDTEEESSDDEGSDDSSEESSDESSEEDEEESSDDEESDDSEDDAGEDDSEGDDEESDEESDDSGDELDANQKAELKDKYKKTFKNTLVKCKFETSFNDLTLEQKVKFFTELAKAWTKNEPNEFMTDKEIEQLNNVVVKPEND